MKLLQGGSLPTDGDSWRLGAALPLKTEFLSGARDKAFTEASHYDEISDDRTILVVSD